MTAATEVHKGTATPDKHVGVRVPRHIYDVIAADAEQQRRPISKHLLYLAEQQLLQSNPAMGRALNSEA